MVRVSRVFFPVTALGPGRRLGIWFQGCSIGCTGCMSRDTWPAAGGVQTSVGQLVTHWRQAREQGATGLTISGGEPSEQPEALVELLEQVRMLEQVRTEEVDILLYTGRELDGLAAAAPRALDLVDVVVTGRYDARQPTTLIWRGSANQDMHLLTRLGRERFARYLDHRPSAPPLQVMVDDRTIWYVGVPRAGDLVRVERELRDSGVHMGASSWRP